MDTNWYMKKLLVTDHQNTLLAAAEVHRLRQQARRPRWSLRPHRTQSLTAGTVRTSLLPDTAPERAAERTAARRAAVVPCTPTWHS
jgi:hypothetical protein